MIILERIEGNVAVLEEDKKNIKVPITLIPRYAKEGDVLVFINGKYIVNVRETSKRRENAVNLQNSLWKK
jgi:hypothetical protein